MSSNKMAGPRSIKVQSGAFSEGGSIPVKYTADGENMSPPVAWSDVPSGTQSLVLMVEDPDAPTPKPFLHWLVYNIPPQTQALPEGEPKQRRLSPDGALQGKNSSLKVGYIGAAPPKGDTPHHYHFEVFALDQVLPLESGAGRSAVLKAMEGHVLAQGDLVATYVRKSQ